MILYINMCNKLYTYYLLLVFGFLNYPGVSQEGNRLSATTRVKKDSIMLRWAPASVPVWQNGIRHGYIIRRYTIAKDGVFIPDGLNQSLLLNDQPIRPFVSEKFASLCDSDYRAEIVYEAIYGTDFQLGQSPTFPDFLQKYKDLEIRMGFALFMCDLSVDISRAAGLYFADTGIVEGERYAYIISPANIPDGMEIEPAIIVADAGTITMLPEVIDATGIFLDKEVKFRWPVGLHKGIYTAYLIEKSLDGKAFNTISDLPLVNLSEEENPEYFIYTDSLEANNQQTWYRIRGINPFGETGPPSRVISGKGIPDFNAYATIDSAWLTQDENVTIRWRLMEGSGSRVTGINILKAESYNGSFARINKKPLDASTRNFTDENPGISNYYQVVLNGEAELRSNSFPYFFQTEDKDPPAPPVMLSGKVDSSGIVTIIWKENTEPDLMGYKVFRANSSKEDFIALNGDLIETNLCNDTINLYTLTQKIYYQVVAIDRNYNSSDYSDVLELSRPDTIAPSPAVITNISFNTGKIIIKQESSPSQDVTNYELYRMSEADTVKKVVASWGKNLPEIFTDTPPLHGQNIIYILKTFDSSGNHSEFSNKVYAEKAIPSEVSLKIDQSTDGRIITLVWESPSGLNSSKTVIYKSIDKEPLTVLCTLRSNESSFRDSDIKINTNYSYMVMIYNSGSNEVLRSKKLVFSPSLRNK